MWLFTQIQLSICLLMTFSFIICPDDYLDAQHSITSIEQWSSSNYLQLKCKYMTISRKKKPITPQRALTLNNDILEQVESYKYLGLLFTADLSWSPHISSICLKAQRILGLIYRRFYGNVSQDALKQLYIFLSLDRILNMAAKFGIHIL